MTNQKKIRQVIAEMDAAQERYYSARQRLESILKPASPKRALTKKQLSALYIKQDKTMFKIQNT